MVLTYLNLARSNVYQKQSNGDASQRVLYPFPIRHRLLHDVGDDIYIHIRGAFSVARFDRQAMREPRYVERAAELASRSFIQKCMLHRGYQ